MFNRDTRILQIQELVVFGKEIIDISFKRIPVYNLERYSVGQKFEYFQDKLFDGRISNLLEESPSCAGINYNLWKIVFNFRNPSVVYFLGIVTLRSSREMILKTLTI